MTLNRIIQWEFWPWWIFYFPIYLYYIWLSLKARSLVFFSAANPFMNLGGLAGYSKYDILERVPEKYKPKCVLLKEENFNEDGIRGAVEKTGISYPFILKPNQGERGFGVEKICSEIDLKKYLDRFQLKEVMLQEYIPFPLELGIMYSRLPGEVHGKISSIVIKRFFTVKGDGVSTVLQLLKNDERGKQYLTLFRKRMKKGIHKVLPSGQTLEMDSIGNHCRGTTFLNGNHLINSDLESIFNRISMSMKDHFFGRFDLKVTSIQDLYADNDIKILEVNGANSEPAHIYDPEMPLLKAYVHLFKHWNRLCEVSMANRQKGVPYIGFKVGTIQLIQYFIRKRRKIKR